MTSEEDVVGLKSPKVKEYVSFNLYYRGNFWRLGCHKYIRHAILEGLYRFDLLAELEALKVGKFIILKQTFEWNKENSRTGPLDRYHHKPGDNGPKQPFKPRQNPHEQKKIWKQSSPRETRLLDTWNSTLQDEQRLPRKRLLASEVLVGRPDGSSAQTLYTKPATERAGVG